jgi:chaperonin GroEL
MPKQSLEGNSAREALQRGLDKVVDAVKVTLGPRGRNVLLDRPGQPLATRDGVTVAKERASLPDPFENMGAQYARECADAAVVESGDGTTTASVILQAIVSAGMKAVSEGAEPLLLADGIQMAAAKCAEFIKAMSIPATPELVRQAAIVSTHQDIELGTLIAEATCKVGPTGVLELQDSRDEKTTIEHLEGFYFGRGWRPNQFFANDRTGQKCVLKKPFILISERPIAGSHDQLAGNHITKIACAVAATGRPFLIVSEDLIGDAMQFMSVNMARGTIQFCFVKLPGFRDKAGEVEDLRIAVGAKRVHSQIANSANDHLSGFTLEDLGWCEEAVITRDRTVLIKGGANDMLLQKRIKQLAEQAREATNDYEKGELEARAARLFGGIAVLKVGANSEPQMLERKARAEDAIHACRGALQEGVVPGGGVALLRAAMAYQYAYLSKDICAGELILVQAICEPAKQIIRNTGHGSAQEVVEALGHHEGKDSWGFNAATGQAGDLYEMGIVDPTRVVLTALTKAASIGALLLTSEVLVTDIPQPKMVMMPPGGAF